MSDPSADLTVLLRRLRDGDEGAFDEVVPAVYQELRQLAKSKMRTERMGHTLQTTALVNEAYLRMARERRIPADSRAEFFAVASHAMRRVLVDYARKRKTKKRGGGAEHVEFEAVEAFLGEDQADEVLALDRALDELAEVSPRAATVVQHRYFTGLTAAETAELLGVSAKTVDRDWQAARAWLRQDVRRKVDLLRDL